MKRIVASVGLVALGAAVIQTSNAQGFGDSKAWTISTALRGFYDDNVNTAPDPNEVDTFGFEISPSIAYELPLEQTKISLGYTFGYKWYDERPSANDDHDDMTHTFVGRLMHQFDERTTLRLTDSFVIGQEPDLDPSYSSFQRISGDNLRNYGSIVVNHQVTPLLGLEGGYANSLFDYDNEGARIVTNPFIPANPGPPPTPEIPAGTFPIDVISSRSGQLDRIEHAVHLDSRWTLANNSIGIVGYQFAKGCYTGDEPIGLAGNGMIVTSSMRDYYSHYGYVGLEHTFRPDFSGSIRGGFRYTDYHESLDGETSLSPYFEGSLRYVYAPDSTLQLGVKHDRSSTDTFSSIGNSITTDVDATSVYASLTHAITADLSGTLTGSFQNNTWNGGSLDGDTEQYYLFSAALAYQISPHISTTLSYNFDHVESDSAFRGYERNRVFLGAVFTF